MQIKEFRYIKRNNITDDTQYYVIEHRDNTQDEWLIYDGVKYGTAIEAINKMVDIIKIYKEEQSL
jgi:hypothetical protein